VLVFTALLHFGLPIIQLDLVTSRDFFLLAIINPVERVWDNAGCDHTAGDWNAQAHTCFQAMHLLVSLNQPMHMVIFGDGAWTMFATLYGHAPQVFFESMILAVKECHSVAAACNMAQRPQFTPTEGKEITSRAGIFQECATRVVMELGSRITLKPLSERLHLQVYVDADKLRCEREESGYILSEFAKLMFFLKNYENQLCWAPSCHNCVVGAR
jgi:hypothetical protein